MVLYLLYRGIRDRKYFHRLAERFGFIPSNSTGVPCIWFHAVSVGEVLAAAELIRRMRDENPRIPVFLSTSTLAGRELADQRIAKNVFFAPLDYRFSVRRVLRRLRPALVVVLETEIWPNLYRESKRAGASLLIVNARISDRALPRYRRATFFFRHVLRFPDAILAQSQQDAERFKSVGARRVEVAGNLKYDFRPPAAIAPDIASFLDRLNPRQIWIAASTMADDIDEDDAVIAAIPPREGLLTIIAPRKPERFDIVASKLATAGLRFVRRTALKDLQLPGVLLVDSIGELAALFSRADVVFMGGTLANRGGHNILEPAFFGKPVILGPHMENFAAIAQEFRDATVRIDQAGELGAALSALLDDPKRRRELGERARSIAESKRGVADRILAHIRDSYAEAIPNPPRVLLARIALTPLSWIWRTGNAVHRAIVKPRKLPNRVISVGGLSAGGSGKTPMVAHLAARIDNAAILARGYKTADEARMLAKYAKVGIGANRYKAAEKIDAGVFLLDDGFQHYRLARDHDIVLIDALDPLARGVLPLGRLREPFSALKRADTVILTRVELGQDTRGIERLIARHTRAPIFRSRVVPVVWIGLDGSKLDAKTNFPRAAAFCGLGVPLSFWRTLDDLGITPATRREFRDHHSYSPAELEELKQNADVLLTTEKDAMNLPSNAAAIAAPAKIYWLRIAIEIEKEDELLRRIL